MGKWSCLAVCGVLGMVVCFGRQAGAAPTVLRGGVLTVGVDDSGGLIATDAGGDLVGLTAFGVDFVSPLYSFEGYSIGVDGRGYYGGYEHNVDITATTTASGSGTVLRAVTTGTDEIELEDGTPWPKIAFEQVMSFSADSPIIDFEVTLRNISSAALGNVVYARYLDPDQNYPPSTTTYNEVISEDLVIAKAGLSSGPTIGIYTDSAYAHNASVVTWQTNPYDLLAAGDFLPNYPWDSTIAIAWDIGSLGVGQEAVITFQYRVGLSPEDVINPPVHAVPAGGAFCLGAVGFGLFGLLRRRGAI